MSYRNAAMAAGMPTAQQRGRQPTIPWQGNSGGYAMPLNPVGQGAARPVAPAAPAVDPFAKMKKDALKAQAGLAKQYGQEMQPGITPQMMDALRARMGSMPMPELPQAAPMQAPPPSQWMQGPMLQELQHAIQQRKPQQ